MMPPELDRGAPQRTLHRASVLGYVVVAACLAAAILAVTTTTKWSPPQMPVVSPSKTSIPLFRLARTPLLSPTRMRMASAYRGTVQTIVTGLVSEISAISPPDRVALPLPDDNSFYDLITPPRTPETTWCVNNSVCGNAHAGTPQFVARTDAAVYLRCDPRDFSLFLSTEYVLMCEISAQDTLPNVALPPDADLGVPVPAWCAAPVRADGTLDPSVVIAEGGCPAPTGKVTSADDPQGQFGCGVRGETVWVDTNGTEWTQCNAAGDTEAILLPYGTCAVAAANQRRDFVVAPGTAHTSVGGYHLTYQVGAQLGLAGDAVALDAAASNLTVVTGGASYADRCTHHILGWRHAFTGSARAEAVETLCVHAVTGRVLAQEATLTCTALTLLRYRRE